MIITSPLKKIAQERKLHKTDTKFLYLWSCKRKYNWEGNRKDKGRGSRSPRSQKRVNKVQNPYVISIDRLIRKDITSFHP